MGPKLLNCCKLEQVGTEEHGKMLKRIQIFEDDRVPAKEAKRWKSEGKKRRITKKEYKRLRNTFEVEGLMAQNGFWNLAREKRITGERCHSQGRSAIREYKAMHEKNFLSSWLRQDLIRKERKVNERAGEEEENKRKRGGKEKGGEKEENGTAKRRCVNFNLAEAFDIFCQGEDLESCGGVSWSDVLDNPDVLSDCLSLGRLCLRCLLCLMCLFPVFFFFGDRVF